MFCSTALHSLSTVYREKRGKIDVLVFCLDKGPFPKDQRDAVNLFWYDSQGSHINGPEMFAQRGYIATLTSEIVQAAGVAEKI
jgi:hypothetical protein